MKGSTWKRIISYCGIGCRQLLFMILFLGLAKAPLAYGCLPFGADDGATVTGQIKNADSPCHHKAKDFLVVTEDTDCCLVKIDHGFRGAENGFIALSFSVPDPDYNASDAVLPAADFYPESSHRIIAAPLAYRQVAPFSQNHPPYLTTQRLRL